MEDTYRSGKTPASSGDLSPKDISAEDTNKKVLCEMPEEQAPELPPWSEEMAGNKSRRLTAKPERGLDALDLRVVESVNDSLPAAVDYRNYHPLKRSSQSGDDVAHKLHSMAKRIAVQLKDRTFSRKSTVSVIAVLQQSKSACNAYRIHEGTEMCMLKYFPTGPARATVNPRVTLAASANLFREESLKSYYTIIQFFFKPYVIDSNASKPDVEMRILRQRLMTAEEFAQQLWTRTLSCGSVYSEESLEALFEEGVTHPIRKSLSHCSAYYQHASIEDLAQRADSPLDLHGRLQKRLR